MTDTPAARILVVDDDDSVRLLVRRFLEKAGYHVDTVDDGLQALQRIDDDPPDLVVSDIMMPELNGLEMIEGLRNHPNTKNLPVVFLTASPDPRHLADSINYGARQYLTKPVTSDKLIEAVSSGLRSRRRAVS